MLCKRKRRLAENLHPLVQVGRHGIEKIRQRNRRPGSFPAGRRGGGGLSVLCQPVVSGRRCGGGSPFMKTLCLWYPPFPPIFPSRPSPSRSLFICSHPCPSLSIPAHPCPPLPLPSPSTFHPPLAPAAHVRLVPAEILGCAPAVGGGRACTGANRSGDRSGQKEQEREKGRRKRRGEGRRRAGEGQGKDRVGQGGRGRGRDRQGEGRGTDRGMQ